MSYKKWMYGLGTMLLGLVPCNNSDLIAQDLSAQENQASMDMRGPQMDARGPQLNWEDFHSTSGQCSVKMPAAPEHVSEKIQMQDSSYELKYDAYIAEHSNKSVYMLLVAQYPDFVDASYAQSSLEAFLNGILSYNPNNQLIHADLSLVDGHEALDFFIRAGAVYFKGRAILIKNSLYLMAMECEVQYYDENSFNTFINSFSLKNR